MELSTVAGLFASDLPFYKGECQVMHISNVNTLEALTNMANVTVPITGKYHLQSIVMTKRQHYARLELEYLEHSNSLHFGACQILHRLSCLYTGRRRGLW